MLASRWRCYRKERIFLIPSRTIAPCADDTGFSMSAMRDLERPKLTFISSQPGREISRVIVRSAVPYRSLSTRSRETRSQLAMYVQRRSGGFVNCVVWSRLHLPSRPVSLPCRCIYVHPHPSRAFDLDATNKQSRSQTPADQFPFHFNPVIPSVSLNS